MASVQRSGPLSLEKVDELLAKIFAVPQFKDLSLLERERSVLDFRYIEILKNAKGLSETLPLDLIDIEIRALKRLSDRAALVGPLEIIRSDVVERYIAAAGTPAIPAAAYQSRLSWRQNGLN